MGRRALALFVVAAALLALASAGLVTYVYRTARSSVDALLARRLEAVGGTAARLVAGVAERDRALADVAAANELDAAYLFDGEFKVVADARGQTGRRANLLRIDPDRARAALDGRASVGWAFDVEGARFLGGYFPVAGAAQQVLAVEAGETFSAPSRMLGAAAGAALAVGGALFVLALLALFAASRAARRTRDANAREERAALASRMAAMVAHEVRNPLGIIRGGAELLREQAVSDGARELADDILGEVARLNLLTEEFLTLSRSAPLQLAPVDLGQLVREVCDGVALRYRDRTLSIDAAGTGSAVADAGKLRQALLNLVLNAAQATDGKGCVSVRALPDGEGVRVAVSDSGPGVPDALRAQLFEPFVTGKASGTGLGLAVARNIFERHGGTVTLVPSESGARFEAWLPSAPPRS